MIALKRITTGIYQTKDDKFRVQHWDRTSGNRKSWAVCEWDGNGWDFVCEVETLADARRYLDGDKSVFILS